MQTFLFLQKTNLFIRSLLFSIITIITAILWSFVCLASFFLPLRYRFFLIICWTNFIIWTLKIICHVNYKIDGLENIPKDRSGIILCKHQSTWETFILPGLFNGPAIILKKELFLVPFFGWALGLSNPIAIDRSKKTSAMDQIITKGKKCLEEGRWILVFPEGTRIPPGKIGQYKLGGPRLAVATEAPVIPIAHNAGRFWPKRQFIKLPGTVHMVIGPLIESKNRTAEEVLEQAKNWIEGTIVKENL